MAPMMVAATALAMLGGILGLYASYHLHTAAGASVAVVMVIAYLAVAAARRRAQLGMSGARTGLLAAATNAGRDAHRGA
jgi:ABC-type Mn2+/Zn2+ transport system permease subunit